MGSRSHSKRNTERLECEMRVPRIADKMGLQGRRGDAERFRLAIIFFHLFPSITIPIFYFITKAGMNSFFMQPKGCFFVLQLAPSQIPSGANYLSTLTIPTLFTPLHAI
jgi:hypothetical protein